MGALVCVALLAGCLDASDPAAPLEGLPEATQPVKPKGSIAGFVIDGADECIIRARVELVDGPQAGAVFVQTLCGFWDYGDDLGYSFHGLPVGVPLTVRATAEGYKSAEIRAAPTNPYSYTTMIVLTPDQ